MIGRLFDNSQFFRAGLKNPNHLILVMINHDENPAILAIKDLFAPAEIYALTRFEDRHDMYV